MKTVNEVKNSYTHYLEPKIKQIYGMLVNDEVSIEAMRKNIFNYIYPAVSYYTDKFGKKHTTKKVSFLNTVNSMESKKDVYWYCYNSISAARKTDAINGNSRNLN